MVRTCSLSAAVNVDREASSIRVNGRGLAIQAEMATSAIPTGA